jgi:hypothetical protein
MESKSSNRRIQMRKRGFFLAKIFAAFFLVLFLSSAAHSQASSGTTSSEKSLLHRAQGYLFVAPGAYNGYGGTTATLHIGGGGEAMVYQGLGVGAEVGAISALQDSGGGLGLFSANGSYHFSRQNKISPFLTGGYSFVFGNGSRNLANFGGGINYWIREKIGLRIEFRDHVYADGSGRHLLGIRVGLAFR